MDRIENDPILGKFFDTPEKKARWIRRFKMAYILWILFVIAGFFVFLTWYFLDFR